MPILVFACAVLAAGTALATAPIPVVVSPTASSAEKVAAWELAKYLARIYPAERFEVAGKRPAAGRAIRLGTLSGDSRLAEFGKPAAAESFVVSHASDTGAIVGADPRGVLFGVYALLEKLGYGFYISHDAEPEPRRGAFDFKEWSLADAPLFGDRIVFNWHNFLSSGSTWELEDWQRWIAQCAKMRYNAVMVHAYGNNPMFSFRHNGVEKPVGYLSTTMRGRDWGTQHVNDVRRLFGGEIFRAPVFGASVALAPEAERTAAAQRLMREVFAYARERGMGVTFALDVCTESANPQEILRTLPPGALIDNGKWLLANPDTPEGYAYYKAQVVQLFRTYPEIDRLAVWFRNNRTPWRDVTPEHFPGPWKAEYEAALAKAPYLRNDKEAHGMFVMGKLLRAFSRALAETGHGKVELAAGSWRLDFLAAADRFFPKEATLIPLDWATIFDTPEGLERLRSVRSGRKLLPVVWAHHDDRTYVGRPYTPYANFASLLRERGSHGYAIIHWTTRPLDLYFKSLGDQVWKSTENQPLEDACRAMAARSFGPAAKDAGGAYLARWVREAPMFGRETGDRFMDVRIENPAAVIAAARERLAMLARIPEAGLTREGKEHLAYHREFERFIEGFFASHSAWERAQDLYKTKDIPAARKALSGSVPEEVIRQYQRASSLGGMSRGEQALVISLNLRWLPYILSLRQALGTEPVRIKLGPTQHEPLAQGAGRNTFYFDKDRRVWKVLGEKETGAPAEEGASADEICATGIRLDKPLSLKLGPITGDALAPGKYSVMLITAPADAAAVEPGAVVEPTGGRLELRLTPRGGASRACAVVIEPVR